MIEKINPEQFTWQRWRAGGLHTFFIPCRGEGLTSPRAIRILKEFAVGYCESERILCRAKKDHVTVMFFYKEKHFWFHLRRREFNRVFGGQENDRRKDERSIKRNWLLYP